MIRNLMFFFATAWVVCAISATPASAAMAVVDIRAIRELVTQIRTLQQQLETARSHLDQAKEEFRAITGARGMEQLLRDSVRNYLPPTWHELESAIDDTRTAYGELSADLQRLLEENAILTEEEVNELPESGRQELESARRSVATTRALTRQALESTSQRFASIQQLIDAIPRASDQKAILDLQARIQAEQNMLANEHSKLEVLFQATQAEESARRQRLKERALADIGSLRALPPMGL